MAGPGDKLGSIFGGIDDFVGFLSGGFGQGLLTILGGLDQQRQFDEAQARNQQSLQEILGIFDNLEGTLLPRFLGNAQDQRRLLEGQQAEADLFLSNRFDRNVGRFESESSDILAQLEGSNRGISEGFARAINDLNARFGERTQAGLAALEGQGDQTRRDIDRRFDELQAAQDQDLTSRGLRSSTIAPSLAAGLQTERSGEQRRLDEQLNRQFADVFAQLSGDELSSRQNLALAQTEVENALANKLINARSGFLGDLTNIDTQLSADRFNSNVTFDNAIFQNQRANDQGFIDLRRELAQNRSNFIASVNNPFPNSDIFTALSQQAGRASASGPEEPGFFDQFGGAIIGGGTAAVAGVSAAGTAAAGSLFANGSALKFFFFCLDGNAQINMHDGSTKSLKTVEIGNSVLGTDGDFHRVIHRDCGFTKDSPHEARKDDYITITTQGGKRLTLTTDHIIAGKRAGDWSPLEMMPISDSHTDRIAAIEFAKMPEVAVDIELSNGAKYWANGFPITSMFTDAREKAEQNNANRN